MKICLRCGRRFESTGWECPACRFVPEKIDGYFAFAPDLSEASEGYRPELFEKRYRVEKGNFWFRSRNRLITWAIGKYFPSAESLMEIGCGTGFVLSGIEREIPRLQLYGSEIYSVGLGFAGSRLKGAELFQMDARSIPFEKEFDVIGAFDVLEHIKDDEKVFSQIHMALKVGGGVILTVPQHPFLWSGVDEYARHVRRYTARELREKVERAGFTVKRMTSFVSLLLPLVVASRSWKKDEKKAELEVSGLMNGVFEKVLGLERVLIRSGLSLPAGSSLLLVAEKD